MRDLNNQIFTIDENKTSQEAAKTCIRMLSMCSIQQCEQQHSAHTRCAAQISLALSTERMIPVSLPLLSTRI